MASPAASPGDPSPDERRDRARGAVVGTAIGDALGAPFEGRRRVHPDALDAWLAGDAALRWTDDTALTIALAESLAACRGVDGEDLARRFVAAWEAEPWRGYGAGPPVVFRAIRAGEPWDAPAARLFGGQGSFGNGAAMRVAPIGVAYGNLETVAAAARASAGVTHTHEHARQGAALQACAVAWLSRRPRPADLEALLTALRPFATAPAYRRALDAVATLAADDADAGTVRTRAVSTLGNGIAAVEAVPAALHAFTRHPDAFADALRAAVLLGGDTDTIGAMAGALAGAAHGHAAIPTAWLARLEAHDRLVAVADSLLTVTD